MPSYKLIYFDALGRAEPLRMVFALKGVEYEDVRVTVDQWETMKEDKKLYAVAQLPVLVVDGIPLQQSTAILRYLGEVYGCTGENSFEYGMVNVIMDTVIDIQRLLFPVIAVKDKDFGKDVIRMFKESTTRFYFNFLEESIQKSGGQYYIGNKLSIADIYVFNWLDIMLNGEYKVDGVLDAYPNLDSFYKFIKEKSPLASYLKSRKNPKLSPEYMALQTKACHEV